MKRPARWLAIASLAVTACAPPGEIAVELGAGEVELEAIAGEPVLPLVAGPQGGHHVWIGAWVEGAASPWVELTVDAAAVDDAAPPPRREPVRIRLNETEGGVGELVGWPAELVDPGCLVGERVTVRVAIVDEAGRRGSDERIIVVGDGPGVPDC